MFTSPRFALKKPLLLRLLLPVIAAVVAFAMSGCGDSSSGTASEKTLRLSPPTLKSNLVRRIADAELQNRFRIPDFEITTGPARDGFQTNIASLQLVGAVDKASGKIVSLTILCSTTGASNRAAAADLIVFSSLVLKSVESSFDMDEAKDLVVGLSKSAMTVPETTQTKYEHGLKISTLFNPDLHALMLFISPAQ